MWPFERRSIRRERTRRSRAERRSPWLRRFLPAGSGWTCGLTLAVALSAALILNAGREAPELRAGQSLPRAITARLEFRVEDVAQTRAMKLQARDTSPNYYRLDNSLLESIRGSLSAVMTLARQHTDDPAAVLDEAGRRRVLLDDPGLAEILRLAAEPDSTQFQRDVDRAVRLLAAQPLVEESPQAAQRTAIKAVLTDPDSGHLREVRTSQLLFASTPDAVSLTADEAGRAFAEPLRASMTRTIANLLRTGDGADTIRPIYRYDSERSLAVAQKAVEDVPPQYNRYARGSVLADAGVVTEDELRLVGQERDFYQARISGPAPQPPAADAPPSELDSYRRLLAERSHARNLRNLRVLGRSILAVFVILGLVGYTIRYQPAPLAHLRRQAGTAALLLLTLALARGMFLLTGAAHSVVGAQALAVALLIIVYPAGVVIALSGALAVLVTLAAEQSIAFLVVLLTVSGAIVLGLREIRNRGKIVAVGAVTSLVALIAAFAAGLFEGQTLRFAIWQQGMWALATTLAAGFLVEGLLPAIERLFSISTSLTLLEWCDANKPLLRHMAADAPGTYNHSLLVGALAEAASDAVGANGLLARAGAYYHDIGKINKPGYFVENQAMGVSRHDRLSPGMSLLIIIGHVKDGIEMAKEYGLPFTLHPFIAEHHGTTLVEYFYHAASQARKPGDSAVSDTEYRYPGPKPQSRETAIVMLCDGVEGAVRAMSEPTPGRIEDTVSRLVQKRLVDGQFDECDLGFRELATVERTLVKTLCSIYHGRIAYPTDPNERAERKAAEGDLARSNVKSA